MVEKTMRAVYAHDYGGPEALALEHAPLPQIQADQVLVRLKAAGVNPADWKYLGGAFRQFMPLKFPWTPGLEGSGIVDAVGGKVSAFKIGDEVYGLIKSAYAEYALVEANDILSKPAGLTFEEAASLPVGALTAWGAVISTAKIEAGQRVLVHGAAGGVGAYAVQLACWKEAHVTGTTSAGNVGLARSLGAEAVVDYQSTRFETILHDMDAVIDTVGGELMERSLQVLRAGGLYVTVAGRPAEDAGKAHNVKAMSAGRAPAETLKQLSELIEAKKIKPVVGMVFPLTEVTKAVELSRTGHGRGRIILHIAD
ncbi:MAG TPA: NADP-dependent oxidoreductase [Anaerolineales bacterium]|nr:NADP-dependent oxidoreductase [Anaerolineales bacterium]